MALWKFYDVISMIADNIIFQLHSQQCINSCDFCKKPKEVKENCSLLDRSFLYTKKTSKRLRILNQINGEIFDEDLDKEYSEKRLQ